MSQTNACVGGGSRFGRRVTVEAEEENYSNLVLRFLGFCGRCSHGDYGNLLSESNPPTWLKPRILQEMCAVNRKAAQGLMRIM